MYAWKCVKIIICDFESLPMEFSFKPWYWKWLLFTFSPTLLAVTLVNVHRIKIMIFTQTHPAQMHKHICPWSNALWVRFAKCLYLCTHSIIIRERNKRLDLYSALLPQWVFKALYEINILRWHQGEIVTISYRYSTRHCCLAKRKSIRHLEL